MIFAAVGGPTLIADIFRAACEDELAAPKPGNVHRHAPGHGMTVADFSASAAAAAGPLCRPGASLGARILDAVRATRDAVGMNTNLGIVLLCAPLAMAAARPGGLREALAPVLREADLADAEAVFAAIRLAAPGGLGQAARHDVRAPATVLLADAMAEAAGRDRIARQWVTGFADVFDLGQPAYAAARARGVEPGWASLAAYLRLLATAPDTHILRKHGAAAAEAVRARAVDFDRRVREGAGPDALLAELLDWDSALKRQGLNPGTSADLAVASGFAARLAAAGR